MLLIITLGLVKFYDLYENFFHAIMIKIHVHTTIPPSYASTLEVSIVSFIYSPT
jgi:hypothetical protein